MLKFKFSGLDNYYMDYCTSMKRDPMKELHGKTEANHCRNSSWTSRSRVGLRFHFLSFRRNPFAVREFFIPPSILKIIWIPCKEKILLEKGRRQETEAPKHISSIFHCRLVHHDTGRNCVIDTCRSLEVRCDSDRSKYNPKTTWASQSIYDQRRGRTGRFRLVHQSF